MRTDATGGSPRRARGVRSALGALLAMAALAGVLAAASYVTMPKNNQAEFGQIDPEANGVVGEPRDSIDVLFIGDSETYSAFSPLQLWHERGIASYVSATPAQRLSYTRTLLERALRAQSPRVVVLETHCIFLGLTPTDAAVRAAKDLLPVIEYHDRWKSLRAEDFLGPVRATWSDELKGFRVRTGVRAADPAGHMAPDDAVAPIAPLARLYVHEIERLCADAGAQLVLVSTPSTANWSTARHNAAVALAAEVGADYVDLNAGKDAVAIDWSQDTHDAGDHLNLSGARKVTTAVGALLSGRYGVPDRRGEGGYELWDEICSRHADLM